jgi:hypothetical protein
VNDPTDIHRAPREFPAADVLLQHLADGILPDLAKIAERVDVANADGQPGVAGTSEAFAGPIYQQKSPRSIAIMIDGDAKLMIALDALEIVRVVDRYVGPHH